jgi:hypothetical protein
MFNGSPGGELLQAAIMAANSASHLPFPVKKGETTELDSFAFSLISGQAVQYLRFSSFTK